MVRRIKPKETRPVGGQMVPVFCEGVDEAQYRELIRRFVVSHYNTEEDKRGCYVVGDFVLPKAKFLAYVWIVLMKRGVIVNGRNIRPYWKMIAELVGSEMTADNSGLSKAQKSLMEHEKFLCSESELEDLAKHGRPISRALREINLTYRLIDQGLQQES